jgi:hypothetical protein
MHACSSTCNAAVAVVLLHIDALLAHTDAQDPNDVKYSTVWTRVKGQVGFQAHLSCLCSGCIYAAVAVVC